MATELTSNIHVAGLWPSLILGTPETAYKTIEWKIV